VWWVCYCAACWVLLCCEYSLLGGCSGFNDEEYVKRRGEIAKTANQFCEGDSLDGCSIEYTAEEHAIWQGA
jgi:hypothetical protein